MRLLRWVLVTATAMVSVTAMSFAFTLVVAHTKLGHTYKVNARHAHQLIGFVNDLENHYGPIHNIGCYSRWGHVRMSQHHIGNACDIEQYGWGRTSYRAMYHARWLAARWGLRDGCVFGDCGHVDAGGPGWVNGAPAGQVAQAEIPATRVDVAEVGVSHEWPRTMPAKATFTLASADTKQVHRKHYDKPKKAEVVPPPLKTAVLWETSSSGTRCVDLGGRMACIARRVVKLG
jgi:hypothetical protein